MCHVTEDDCICRNMQSPLWYIPAYYVFPNDLAKAEYIEVDVTYNENTDLLYLWNVTAFDYNVMRQVAVARKKQ